MSDQNKSVNIKVSGRLSFPALFKPTRFSEDQEPKYKAAIIFDKKKDAAQIKVVQAAIAEVVKENFKGKSPPAKSLCLRDGAEKADTDGYGPDVLFLSTSSAKKIPVVDKDLTPLDETDGKPYAGCYVNVSVRLWAQDNKWGKRVNAQLRAVQFVRDGEAFGDKGTDPNEVFEKVEGDDEPSGDSGML